MTRATLERPHQQREALAFSDTYHAPIIAELAQRVDIVRQGGIPQLVIERRWADLPSAANIEHYNLRPDQGPGNSFKSRGAYTAVRNAVAMGYTRIGTASAGNHAQGIAHAARWFADQGYDTQAKVWMPATTPDNKVNGVRSFDDDGDLIAINMAHSTFEAADAAARADQQYYYISPYDNYDVVAGQGTGAVEALAEYPDADKLFVTVGGGGLLAGTLEAVATLKEAGFAKSNLTVVAVMLEGNDSLLQTMRNNWTPSPATGIDTLAEGAAVPMIGAIPAKLIQRYQQHLEVQTVTRSDLAATQHQLERRSSNFPADETTSLIVRAGAQIQAQQRNRYDTPEVWLTMTTGTNASQEKLQTLRDLYQHNLRQDTARLRHMARTGFGAATLHPSVPSNQSAVKHRTLGVASGYVLR